MLENQQAFDALKEAFVAAPILSYPDFKREFMLQTNASLQGLGTVLFQQDETGKLCVIAYVSQSLLPSKKSMYNYSSAKLKLLTLKWAVMEKIPDYLLGSIFHVYIENSLLDYVKRANQVHHRLSGYESWPCLTLSSIIELEGPIKLWIL